MVYIVYICVYVSCIFLCCICVYILYIYHITSFSCFVCAYRHGSRSRKLSGERFIYGGFLLPPCPVGQTGPKGFFLAHSDMPAVYVGAVSWSRNLWDHDASPTSVSVLKPATTTDCCVGVLYIANAIYMFTLYIGVCICNVLCIQHVCCVCTLLICCVT